MHDWNHFIVILWDYFYDFHSKFCSISYVHKKKKKNKDKENQNKDKENLLWYIIPITSRPGIAEKDVWHWRSLWLLSTVISSFQRLNSCCRHSEWTAIHGEITAETPVCNWCSLKNQVVIATQVAATPENSRCTLACFHTTYTQKRPKH